MGSAASRAAGRLTRLVKDPRMVGIGLASGTVAATGADTCRTITGGADDDPVVPLELYCEIAKFYSVVDDTFHNMLRAAGPRNAAYFRRYYLAGNNHYLLHSLRGGRDKRDRQWRRSKIRPWLTANPEWRQFVRPDLIRSFHGAHLELSVLHLFNNPIFAVMFGFQDMLEYQIETMVSSGIDVNRVCGPPPECSLLAFSVLIENYPAFNYLLSVSSIDVHGPAAKTPDVSGNWGYKCILGYALSSSACTGTDREAFVQALLGHPSIDVNEFCVIDSKGIGFRPLHVALVMLRDTTTYRTADYHSMVRVIELLIRAGADPDLDAEITGSPNDLLQELSSRSILSRMKFRAVRQIYVRGL